MQSVFTLILVAGFIAIALVVANHGIKPFDWQSLGTVSFLVEWVFIASAGALCLLRSFLARRSLLLCSFTAQVASAQTSEYQGWSWDLSLRSSGSPLLEEELCGAQVNLSVTDADATWTAAGSFR